MPDIYNAEEVFEIGIEIEKNGKEFYQKAADKSDDIVAKKFFTDLAKWEDSHISLFADLKAKLTTTSDDELWDFDNEKNKYLKAAADTHIFLKDVNIDNLVAGCTSVSDIINIAIQFEKDSVVLYNTIMSLVPQNLGKSKIQPLIDEEIKHVAILQEKLASFS